MPNGPTKSLSLLKLPEARFLPWTSSKDGGRGNLSSILCYTGLWLALSGGSCLPVCRVFPKMVKEALFS